MAEALLAGSPPVTGEPASRGRRCGSARASTSTPSPTDPTGPWCWVGSPITGDGSGASTATATPMPWPTPSPTPCSGAAGLGDLGRTRPTPTRVERGGQHGILARMVELAADGRMGAGQRRLHGGGRAPAAGPVVARMAERLGEVLGAPVNVKATRAEGLGALGRAEGIACTAVVLLTAAPGRRPAEVR